MSTRFPVERRQRAFVASSLRSMAFWRANIAKQKINGNAVLVAAHRDMFDSARMTAKAHRMHAEMAGVVLP